MTKCGTLTFMDEPVVIRKLRPGTPTCWAIVLQMIGALASAAAQDTAEIVGGQSSENRPWHAVSYPASEAVTGIEFDASTRQTHALGSDIWPITWADDGHQYAAYGDGAGFGVTTAKESNGPHRVSLGVARIEGGPQEYRGINVWGGKGAQNPATFTGKGTGILSVNGNLYMWVAGPGSLVVGETRLAVSRDQSRTWQLADWKWTMRDRLFAGTFLNFGRDYQGARDEYVYSYFTRIDDPPAQPRNWMHEVPGRVDLARVPKDRILHRNSFEWFAGLNEQGDATWTSAMAARTAAFEDANGVKVVSVCRAPRLGRYLLAYNPRDNRGNFGLFEALEPWGPWKTVAYLRAHQAFMPAEPNRRVSIFHFAPKWWDDDGRSFTLVFNPGDDAWNTMRGRLLVP